MNCSHSMTAADWIAEQRRIAPFDVWQRVTIHPEVHYI